MGVATRIHQYQDDLRTHSEDGVLLTRNRPSFAPILLQSSSYYGLTMASISTPALKSFESLDTSQLQPCLSEMLKQIETLHDQVRQTDRDPNSPDFNKTENLLEKARAAIEVAQNFVNQLIQFAVGCHTDCDDVLSKATKELDSTQVKALLRELLKHVENAITSIGSLDAIIEEITNGSLNKVQVHSLDAQIADKMRSAAVFVSRIVGATSLGTILTSVAFAFVTLGAGLPVSAAVISSTGLGVGIVATIIGTRKYSHMIAKHEQLKEKYSCVSKSASNVQELIPELKTTVERIFDEIKKWSQEEVVKNELEELRSVCEKQHPQLAITHAEMSC